MKPTREQVQQFVDDAAADGWQVKAIYRNDLGDIKLSRDGFIVHAYLDPNRLDSRTPQLSAWGPDGLAISPVPMPYSMTRFLETLTYCSHCGAKGVETFRYSFAGRACSQCLPALKAEHEKPGWTN